MIVIPLKKKAISASPCSVVRKTLSTRELGPGKSGDRDFWIRALLISGLISHLDLSLIFWFLS